MSSRHILVIIPEFPVLGGMEKMTARLADALAGRGCYVSICSAKPKKGLQDIDQRFGHPVRMHHVEGWDDPEIRSEEITDLIAEERIDIVINGSLVSSPVTKVMCMLKEKCNVPVVKVVHTEPKISVRKPLAENEGSVWRRLVKLVVWPWYERRCHTRYVKAMRTTAEYADAIVVLYPEYESRLLRILGGQARSGQILTSIPNFIDLEEKDLTGPRLNRLIYCGRVTEHTKRFSRVLKIWEKTASLFPDWELNVIGDGPDMNRYKRYVEKHGLRGVNFQGYVADPSSRMREAKILLLTSDREGMGLVVAEAQTEGCVPVIYDSFGGAKHLISNGEDGLLIPPFDEDQFIRGLHQLMQSPEELERMSRNAVRNSEKYAPGPVLDQWEALIERLIDERL